MLSHYRQKISSGVPAIHLLSFFVSGMEEKATDINDLSYNSDLQEMYSFFIPDNSAEKDIFDDLKDAEESERFIFTSLQSSKFRFSSATSNHESPEDFCQNGCSL